MIYNFNSTGFVFSFRDFCPSHLYLRDMVSIFQDMHYISSEKRQRFLMIFKVVEIILRQKNHPIPVEKSIKCWRMLYETIPEPIITCNEVGFFFEFILEESSHRFIPQICCEYVSKYPDGVTPLMPRSLLHLSRCKVRECLRITGGLPYDVEKLEIPECLKSYILIEWYRKI